MGKRNHQADTFSVPMGTDAEQMVLGGILNANELFPQVASIVSESDFGLEKHRLLFRVISEMLEAHELVTPRTLATTLNSRNELQSVDGVSYLTSLDVPLTEATARSYAESVKKASVGRQIQSLGVRMQSRVSTGDTIEEILDMAQAGIVSLSEKTVRQELEPVGRIIDTYPGGINVLLDPAKRKKGISTGFLKLDDSTGGLHEGELIILAARPMLGKSSFALNIAQHVAAKPKGKKAVAVFSLEMSKESLLTRMFCSAARVDQQKFRSGYLNQSERTRLQESVADIHSAPLFIDDSAGTNLLDIHAKLRRVRDEEDLGLVIVDYLQLMEGPKRENRVQEISALSRGLKVMAKDFRVPFLVLSQLSRAPETRQGDHRPMLSDLRESGSIEQDADIVMFIFREEVYRPDKKDVEGIAEILIAKQRNGPTGKVKLAWLKKFTKFENLATEEKGGVEPYDPPPDSQELNGYTSYDPDIPDLFQ
jgi:replicative DNA helicase